MEIRISAADPLNLVGVILPGPRVPALPTNYIVLRGGLPVRTGQYREMGTFYFSQGAQTAQEGRQAEK
jgi:ATP-dependent Lhr-like helicase